MDSEIYATLGLSEGITDSTKKNYATQLRRVQRICSDSFSEEGVAVSIREIVMQPKRTMRSLNRAMHGSSLQSLSQMVLAIKAVLNHAGDTVVGVENVEKLKKKWASIHAPMDAKVKSDRMKNIPTKHQALSMLTWSKVYDNNLRLRSICDGKKVPTACDVADLLLSSMYVTINPRRVLDYSRLYIMTNALADIPDGTTGIIDMTKKRPTITVTSHKNMKHSGKWTKIMPAQLVADLKLSLSVTPRSYAFETSRGEPYNSSDVFSAYQRSRLLAWFGVPATPTTLRHSRASQVAADPTMSLQEKDAIAKEMGHALSTHFQYAFRPVRAKDGSFEISIFDPILKRYVAYICQRKKYGSNRVQS